MEPKVIFEEKQYIGFNAYSISRRMVLAIFCFVAYYYTEEREKNADLLFVLGIFILVVSVVLLFVKYLHIKVTEGSVFIRGMLSTRLVKIDLSGITSAEKTVYSRYHLNNPAFNVHVAKTIKFYSGGKDAIRLTDKDGLTWLIGTSRADEFLRAVQSILNKNKQ
jgi:hypothetical protein